MGFFCDIIVVDGKSVDPDQRARRFFAQMAEAAVKVLSDAQGMPFTQDWQMGGLVAPDIRKRIIGLD